MALDGRQPLPNGDAPPSNESQASVTGFGVWCRWLRGSAELRQDGRNAVTPTPTTENVSLSQGAGSSQVVPLYLVFNWFSTSNLLAQGQTCR